jgi:GNAT superfamily N-acetyltransferase
MIQFEKSVRLAEAVLSLRLLEGLGNYYPDFHHWYVNKVMPGIILGEDILVCAKDKGRLVGVALGKKRAGEVKLRCVRVEPEYQHRGVGLHLVDRMLVELGADKPHCTVAEEMLHQFSRPFINHYRFSLDEVDKGMYRPGKLEYVFNAPKSAVAVHGGPSENPYPDFGVLPSDPSEEALRARVFDLSAGKPRP